MAQRSDRQPSKAKHDDGYILKTSQNSQKTIRKKGGDLSVSFHN